MLSKLKNGRKHVDILILILAYTFISTLNCCADEFYHYQKYEFRYKETVGVVTKPLVAQAHGSGQTQVEYMALGKKRKAFVNWWCGYCKGDKYIVKYDSTNPKWYIVLEDKPLFLKDEKTGWDIGTIGGRMRSDDYILGFSYFVGGKKFDRCQIMSKPVQDYPGLQKDAKYKIRYWLENPQRAILYLDSPVYAR